MGLGEGEGKMGETLKIAVISPPYCTTPPRFYAGTELVAWNTAKGLHDLGHEVALITIKGSGPADFELIETSPSKETPSEDHFEQYRDRLTEFDAIIDNTNYKKARTEHPAVLNVHHWCQDPSFSGYSKMSAVSEFLASWLNERCPSWRRVPVVYNAVDTDLFPYTPEKEDYLLFFSMIARYKGALDALEAARITGQRTIFAGRMGDAGDAIKEAGLPNVELLGEVSFEEKVELMRHARALLFPTGGLGKNKTDWIEVFGLVQVEANACGTPSISADNAAPAEIVEDGYNGYIVRSLDEMIEVIGMIDEIDPRDCRKAAEERFSIPVMSRRYAALCRRLADGETW